MILYKTIRIQRFMLNKRNHFNHKLNTFPTLLPNELIKKNELSDIEENQNISIMRQTNELETKYLIPLNKKILGPIERTNNEDKLTSLPFVFLLGNHSSGKSSFINYVLGRKIQTTGVAPTDDGFTIIAPGECDLDQDGPSLIGDPDLGFSGLRNFGPSLIQRAQLKIRKNDKKINFLFIDSPGMIDNPSEKLNDKNMSKSINNNTNTREYDFPQVIRWFSERADVILLFFDPDKPGTTGETLSILTTSLLGMDHKLHIILNKVDQFEKIHDFARSYGSLCWNLSKVIHRKDLPRIYTMYLPDKNINHIDNNNNNIEDVITEVFRAPERRTDNLITRLYNGCRLLQIHSTIYSEIREIYYKEKQKKMIYLFGLFTISNATSLSLYYYLNLISLQVTGGICLLTTFISGIFLWKNKKDLNILQKKLISDEGMDKIFRKEYGREIAEGDEFLLSLWKRVYPQLKMAFNTLGMDHLPKVKKNEILKIKQIIEHDIPILRRKNAPIYTSLAHKIASILR